VESERIQLQPNNLVWSRDPKRYPSNIAGADPADAAFYSGKKEAAAKAKGVKRVCVPNCSTKSIERKHEQRKRWFRSGQKWRTG
jgi:hypothetical protein